jgi:peptidoglycan/xylan/chitin deacetylase (PgdA/CDA1 family)
MFRILQAVSVAALFCAPCSQALAEDCADDPRTTGLSRVIAIDSAEGGTFGRLQYTATAPLRKGEVVLTFDDGPHPTNTKIILDTLDRHCVKATFFTVGRMAMFHPELVKDIARRGHTIATHTWSHPRSLAKLPIDEAKLEVEKGFVAASYALGYSISPFMRYPGLNHSQELNAYLATRHISVWSVDVVSNDTVPGLTPEQLINNTMGRIRGMRGGIVLFHDLKDVTAAAMDSFLTQLKLEGFKVVHVVSNTGYQPNPDLVARLDFSKKALSSVAFTGVGSTGETNPNDASQLLATGQVDYMKSEFVDIEEATGKADVPEAASATH